MTSVPPGWLDLAWENRRADDPAVRTLARAVICLSGSLNDCLRAWQRLWDENRELRDGCVCGEISSRNCPVHAR